MYDFERTVCIKRGHDGMGDSDMALVDTTLTDWDIQNKWREWCDLDIRDESDYEFIDWLIEGGLVTLAEHPIIECVTVY